MNIGNLAGIAIGTKLVNGKFRPKYSLGAVASIIIMSVLIILSVGGIFFGIFVMDRPYGVEFAGAMVVMLGLLIYVFTISPYTQNPDNYRIVFQTENSMNGFRLYYRRKQVVVWYVLGKDGKIAFADDMHKLNCLSYADGSRMGRHEKRKILNYFMRWLSDYDLLSSDVRVSIEY